MTINELLDKFFSTSAAFQTSIGISLDSGTVLVVAGLLNLVLALVLYLVLSGKVGKFFIAIAVPFVQASVPRVARNAVRYIKEHCEAGNPDLALKAAEAFVTSTSSMVMHVGDKKGELLDQLIARENPETVLELGAYFGYSAVRMSRLLKKREGKVYSLELNPACADVSRELIQFCHLEKRAEVFTGAAAEGIEQFRDRTGRDAVDFVFIDHWKDAYLSDLKRLEASGLMHKGTVVVADNMLVPGVPDYLEYVSKSPRYITTLHPFVFDKMSWLKRWLFKKDAMTVSIYQGAKDE